MKVFICMMPMLLAVWAASTNKLDCTNVCADPNRHDESEAAHCGCPHSHSKLPSMSTVLNLFCHSFPTVSLFNAEQQKWAGAGGSNIHCARICLW